MSATLPVAGLRSLPRASFPVLMHATVARYSRLASRGGGRRGGGRRGGGLRGGGRRGGGRRGGGRRDGEGKRRAAVKVAEEIKFTKKTERKGKGRRLSTYSPGGNPQGEGSRASALHILHEHGGKRRC